MKTTLKTLLIASALALPLSVITPADASAKHTKGAHAAAPIASAVKSLKSAEEKLQAAAAAAQDPAKKDALQKAAAEVSNTLQELASVKDEGKPHAVKKVSANHPAGKKAHSLGDVAPAAGIPADDEAPISAKEAE